MIVRLQSGTVDGIEAISVDVEVDISKGFPSISTIGLAEGALRESKERVRSALLNSGFHFPKGRITINLAPAGVRKDESYFDLPIAVGLIAASRQMGNQRIGEYFFLGELALSGAVKPVSGILPLVIEAKKHGLPRIILPSGNASEAAIVEGLDIYPVNSLAETIAFFNQTHSIEPFRVERNISMSQMKYDVDFSEVRGQEAAKRAIEIAAAGGHNLLMIGPPGSGKSMMAIRLPTILPELSFAEAVETTKIYSVSGLLQNNPALMNVRPFRAPHHTISDIALVGGGRIPKPGEISLAHNGVLFLDELPEFPKTVIEVLRQPIENKKVTVSRASGTLCFPCSFMLVAAMNPCPCGYYQDTRHDCNCSERMLRRYQTRISGPMLDRIDLQITVPAVQVDDLIDNRVSESSEKIRQRVAAARRLQIDRFAGEPFPNNASMNEGGLRSFGRLDKASKNLLSKAIAHYGYSGRAVNRIVKVARTIADLDSASTIGVNHLAEAIQYRSLDKLGR